MACFDGRRPTAVGLCWRLPRELSWLPRRVCCAQPSAMLGQHVRAPERAQGGTAPTLIRTDTTLDHSQKAEKVCTTRLCVQRPVFSIYWACVRRGEANSRPCNGRSETIAPRGRCRIWCKLLLLRLAGGCWAEAPVKIARMTLTIKLDRNWSSFQLANSAPPLSVTDSAIAPSARMLSSGGFPHCRCWWARGVCFRSARPRKAGARPHCVKAARPAAAATALELGPESPSKIQEVTLMRPIHGNL